MHGDDRKVEVAKSVMAPGRDRLAPAIITTVLAPMVIMPGVFRIREFNRLFDLPVTRVAVWMSGSVNRAAATTLPQREIFPITIHLAR